MSKPAKKSKATKPLVDKNGEVRELTAADLKRMRPASEVVPDLLGRKISAKSPIKPNGVKKLPRK